jgi:hypothetical protein
LAFHTINWVARRLPIIANSDYCGLLPAAFKEKSKYCNETCFTLLRNLLAKPSRLHPSTMGPADYRSGIPSLPTMPSPDKKNSEWSWLIVVCLGAGWGHQGGLGTMCLALIVFFCVCAVLHGCSHRRK